MYVLLILCVIGSFIIKISWNYYSQLASTLVVHTWTICIYLYLFMFQPFNLKILFVGSECS